MTKKHNRSTQYEYAYEEDYNERAFHDELKERRKLKRMRNAMRSKNISDLYDYEEDEY